MKPFKTSEKRDSLANYYEYKIEDRDHIKVSLFYSLGGMNYFTSNVDPRGIYLSVAPVNVTEHKMADGSTYTSVESTLLGKRSGYKRLVMELKKKILKICQS